MLSASNAILDNKLATHYVIGGYSIKNTNNLLNYCIKLLILHLVSSIY